MVVLTEMNSVFWGVILEGGKKKYTQTTEKPVHISMAALDPSKPCGDGPVSVMIEHGTGSYVLCSLQKSSLLQQPLNLEFAAGEEISFAINGTGCVHLSGYVMPEDDFQQYGDMSGDEDLSEEDMESDEEDDDDSDEDEAVTKQGKKRQIAGSARASKRAKITLADMEDDDDEDDSEDDDFIIDEAEEASDDDDDDEEDDEEDEDEDEEESPKPVAKKNKSAVVEVGKTNTTTTPASAKNATTPTASGKNKDKAQNEKNVPKQQAAPVAAAAAAAQPKDNGEAEGKKKKKKNKKKRNKNKAENPQQTPEPSEPSTSASPAPASKVPAKRVAEGGVVIEDLKQGHGPEAKVGKKVAVYYTGRLLNGKVFDCCTNGNGFKFKLGKKEVISGWDIGVSGMKVGGKRKLVIPPKMGYGSSKAGPIPANSTLVFDVELKSVN